ncbi:MAG: single-stranded DNA-binding protein [Thermotogota bacterium]
MSLNKAMLIGRLGKDPELSYTQSGTARCRFSLATSEVFTDNSGNRQEKTEWHHVVVWGKQAESAGKFLQKGREVFVEGKIETRSWDDEKSGQKRYMTEVKAQRVIFLGGGRGEGGGDGGSKSGNQSGPGYQGDGNDNDGAGSEGVGGGNTGPDGDDDVPF